VKTKVPVELHCPGSAPMRTSTDELSSAGVFVLIFVTLMAAVNDN
jgi:hypothetical protein